jgi:hypothetical protein
MVSEKAAINMARALQCLVLVALRSIFFGTFLPAPESERAWMFPTATGDAFGEGKRSSTRLVKRLFQKGSQSHTFI